MIDMSTTHYQSLVMHNNTEELRHSMSSIHLALALQFEPLDLLWQISDYVDSAFLLRSSPTSSCQSMQLPATEK